MSRPWCRSKDVCRSWQLLFTNTIHAKASTPKAFQSRAELKEAVDKYTMYNPVDAEEFAETYGWPIGRWDVSNIQDFSGMFLYKGSFNENIGSWDVSSATSMCSMFTYTRAFNQDISSWNVSNFDRMECMFNGVTHFNQDISSWNVSNVF
jgi:surface protein